MFKNKLDIERFGKRKMNWRKIFVISIIVICIVCINLAVYLKIVEKDETTQKPELIIDTVALTENFENIFDNTIDIQNNNIQSAKKQDTSKELVYSSYEKQEKQGKKYDINIHIPYINIEHENIKTINQEIEELFYKKVTNIMTKTDNIETIYDVKYKAYVNDNILSLVISSNLKESTNSQRLIIKTYNYNISSNEILNMNQILNYRSLNAKKVQTQINDVVKEAAKTSETYQQLGYQKYLRNLNDEMYKVENTKVFFLGEGKSVYILYPYGNSNYTTEMDLVVI